MKITLIGAGNVATHLGGALVKAGHEVVAVVSRTEASATALAEGLGCPSYAIDAFRPSSDSDLFIISVKDDAVAEVAERLIPIAPNAIWVHTAGSLPMSILEGHGAKHVGVFYPMQTFSRTKAVDFSRISLFLESNTCLDTLQQVATSLTKHVYQLDSEGRKHLHLAAVFACNFVNHCYALSAAVLHEVGIPFEVMLPLIDETANKVHTLSPRQAQTGPAIRNDHTIMQRQHDLLADSPQLQQIYDLLSQSIQSSLNTK